MVIGRMLWEDNLDDMVNLQVLHKLITKIYEHDKFFNILQVSNASDMNYCDHNMIKITTVAH